MSARPDEVRLCPRCERPWYPAVDRVPWCCYDGGTGAARVDPYEREADTLEPEARNPWHPTVQS